MADSKGKQEASADVTTTADVKANKVTEKPVTTTKTEASSATVSKDTPNVVNLRIDLGNKLSGVVDWIEKWGERSKNPLLAFIALLLVDFGPAKQLLKAFGVGANHPMAAVLTVLKKAWALLIVLIAVMVISTVGVYTIGGGLLIVISGISMFLLTTCIAVILGVYDFLAVRSKDPKKKGPKDLGRHIMYWVLPVMAANIIYKPWQTGNLELIGLDKLELFGLLVIAELGLFILSQFTRNTVCYASGALLTVVGVVVFLLMSWSLLPTSITRVISGLSLTDEEQICDLNGNGRLDHGDVDMIKYVLKDMEYRISYVQIHDQKFILGDFNQDGILELKDADALTDHIDGVGPGPSPLIVTKTESPSREDNSSGETHSEVSDSSYRSSVPTGYIAQRFQPVISSQPSGVAKLGKTVTDVCVEVPHSSVRMCVNSILINERTIHASVTWTTNSERDSVSLVPRSLVSGDGGRGYSIYSNSLVFDTFYTVTRHESLKAELIFTNHGMVEETDCITMILEDARGQRYSVPKIVVLYSRA